MDPDKGRAYIVRSFHFRWSQSLKKRRFFESVSPLQLLQRLSKPVFLSGAVSPTFSN